MRRPQSDGAHSCVIRLSVTKKLLVSVSQQAASERQPRKTEAAQFF